MRSLVDRLQQRGCLRRNEYVRLLTEYDHELLTYINTCAREVSEAHFGKSIYVRGLIELTNCCRNNCLYCGIRKENTHVERYRLSKEQVLACCRLADRLKIKTFVLQGGEDAALTDLLVEDLVKAIRSEFPHSAITLSLGERSREAYQSFFKVGANRYLLRHETATPSHYAHLHPAEMLFDTRMQCLRNLKEIGYQTGAGMMIGSPRQSAEHLAEDLLFLKEFEPEMIGMGPFVPQHDTPFANETTGSVETTLMLISIVRLMFPKALIPATTSLATLDKSGYEKGILAGANVVMPNMLPVEFKSKYVIYDDKESILLEPETQYRSLKERIESIGYSFSDNRGDYENN